MPSLSLCMIVRDGEATLAAALNSARPFMDEMIVVDTGSTDRTRQIAEECGAKVFDFPWCDSFAAARNHSIDQATGDWIFWMDADDVLPPESGPELRKLIEDHPKRDAAFWVFIEEAVERNGRKGVTAHGHIKLFPRDEKLRFRYRIHEQITPALSEAGIPTVHSKATVRHVTDRSPAAQDARRQRNLRLALLDQQDRPDDPFVLLSLGLTHMYWEGGLPKSIEFLRQSVAKCTKGLTLRLNAYLYLAEALHNSGDLQAEEVVYREALEEFPDDVGILRRLGKLCDQAGRLEDAAGHYRTILTRGRERTSAVQVRGGQADIALRLGQIYEQLDERPRAERLWEAYLKINPKVAAIRKSLQASYLKSSTLTTTASKASLAPTRGNGGVRGITICVDFADILAITLPRNARHFKNILVVTSPDDHATAAVVKTVRNASLFTTDAFYRDGAAFNLNLAREVGLDAAGREGWLAIFDTDIILPQQADFSQLPMGYLFSAHRRILMDTTAYRESLDWRTLPLAGDQEFAGYLQVFHASDPVLNTRPWYGTNWIHAGGGDSEFQRRWPISRKFRFAWEVLHLGPPGENWCGRVTKQTDGSRPAEADKRTELFKQIIAKRKATGSFEHEKLPG